MMPLQSAYFQIEKEQEITDALITPAHQDAILPHDEQFKKIWFGLCHLRAAQHCKRRLVLLARTAPSDITTFL